MDTSTGSPTLVGVPDDDSWDPPIFSEDEDDVMLTFLDDSCPPQSQPMRDDYTHESSLPDFDLDLDFDFDDDNQDPEYVHVFLLESIANALLSCVKQLEGFVLDFLTQLVSAAADDDPTRAKKGPKPITLQIADRSKKSKDPER